MSRGYGGASPEAIRAHYDRGSAFYLPWLGSCLTYSSALWEGEEDTLEQAQARKLDLLASWAGARPGARVLDIGCGWGSLLRRLTGLFEVAEAVGLTLSEDQHRYLERKAWPRTQALLCNWADHEPRAPYDGIVALESVEHAARLGLSRPERVDAYRTLFARCHGMLRPGGCLVVQATTYRMDRFELPEFITTRIWPESDLPTQGELLEATEGLFEPLEIRDDAHDYLRTIHTWIRLLRGRRHRVVAAADSATVLDYERYLRQSARAFQTGRFSLLRLRLERSGG